MRITRFGIYESRNPGHDWVHSKLFVIDDEVALVGSANANNRGYFTDSEAAIIVAERASRKAESQWRGDWASIEGNFARRMRISLWNEHLGLPESELFDGIGAKVHWDNPPSSAKIGVYRAANIKKYNQAWDEYLNGKGSDPRVDDPLDNSDRKPWTEFAPKHWDVNPEDEIPTPLVDPKWQLY
ncbi:MAG: hypothetical protein IPK82_43965 [Polyangiaceae bacterium]|nr:hypothetical protein [Polyangiaceae bacterium]